MCNIDIWVDRIECLETDPSTYDNLIYEKMASQIIWKWLFNIELTRETFGKQNWVCLTSPAKIISKLTGNLNANNKVIYELKKKNWYKEKLPTWQVSEARKRKMALFDYIKYFFKGEKIFTLKNKKN